MAKKGSRQSITSQKAMVDFAEDLGRILGTAQAKASNWLNQRKDVIEELTQLRDTANQLLNDLTGGQFEAAARRVRRGRRAGLKNGATAGGRRAGGRRPMSAAGRRAVSVRMKKYWAARRREKAKAASA